VFTSPFPFTRTRRRIRRALRITLGVASAIATSALSAGPAQAAIVSTGACNENALTQPFLRWGDSNLYELAAGGSFEGSVSGWTLSGGAQQATGSEPYAATGSLGKYSLTLPAGASVQSPFTCVNVSYPSFRFFARNNGLFSTLLVQVVYKTPVGYATAPIGIVAPGAEWQPTLPMLTGSIVGGVLSNGTGQVALRFTALTGSSSIDDVFIDPRMR
jgi:hypothetical protein